MAADNNPSNDDAGGQPEHLREGLVRVHAGLAARAAGIVALVLGNHCQYFFLI